MGKRVRLLTSAATDRGRFMRGMRYPCQVAASRDDVVVEADRLAVFMRASFCARHAVRTMGELQAFLPNNGSLENRAGVAGRGNRASAIRQSWRADHAGALELRNAGIP